MPSMGADMDSGTLVQWKVKPGDQVRKGQVIAAVETSKGILDVEVFEDGVVEELYVAEDTEVDVGTPLARIGDGSHIVSESPGASGKAEAKEEPEAEEPPKVEQPPTTKPPEPADADAAAEPKPEPAPEPKAASEPPQPVSPEPPAPTPSPAAKPAVRDRIWASPAARRRAREAGIPLSSLQGTGPDGAVVLRDLAGAPTAKAEPRPQAGFDRTQMRATIAAAMSRAKRDIPHYYLATTVDLHAAEHWLADYNQHQPPENRLLLSALFMKAAALALARYPELNGHYTEDGFIAAPQVNLGMAVHLRGGGLVAPAIIDADALTLPELMQRLRDLVRRARGGGLRASEMGGGTATVTALGDRGVDTVYGVIYPPQVAMIGIGRPRRRPLAVDDAVAVRLAVDLSLAADHRVCDGHLGALFLNEMEQRLQQPEAL